MLRRVMGTFVALMLVATLLLPLASVSAQEDTDPGAPPVVTEETIPESEPPPAVEEPPIAEPQPELPLVAEPVVEPPAEEPATGEPAGEDPAAVPETGGAADPVAPDAGAEAGPAEDDAQNQVADVETGNDDSVEPSEGIPSVISNVTVDCSGLVSFSFVSWHGEELTISVGTTDPSDNPGWGGELNSIIFMNSTGSDFSSRITFDGDPADIFATVYSIEGGLIGQSPIVICHEGWEPDTDPGEEPDDEEEPGQASVLTAVSVTCDGTVTFTIAEAQPERLWITLSDPDAPLAHRDLAEGSFDVTETGTFTLDFQLADQRDSVRVDIGNSSDSWSAQVHDCLTEEWETDGLISGMTVSCDGAVAFTVEDDLALPAGLHLYGAYGGSWQPIGAIALIPLRSGGQVHQFELPANTWDSLRAEVRVHNSWQLSGIAEVSGCLDEEPGPVLPVVENLTVDCTGLVTFDLDTSEPVTLDVSIFIPAAAPGYRDETQITAESGPQRVQFDLPVQTLQWAASVFLGSEWLADATVSGCPMNQPNTPTGSDVAVPVAGGTVTFDNVTTPGETFVTQLHPEFAPPLPAQYAGQLVIMVDLSTTAVFDGAVEVCLPIVGEAAADPENVRLLHYENGGWVDITTSVSGSQVCGVTSSFSPFAIVKLSGQEPDGPGEPGGPQEPGHHGPKPGAHHPQHGSGPASGSVSLTSLPNTGSGAQTEGNGAQTVHILLAALALLAAGSLRLTPRKRGTRSR